MKITSFKRRKIKTISIIFILIILSFSLFILIKNQSKKYQVITNSQNSIKIDQNDHNEQNKNDSKDKDSKTKENNKDSKKDIGDQNENGGTDDEPGKIQDITDQYS